MNEIWDRQYHTFVLNTIEKNKNIKKHSWLSTGGFNENCVEWDKIHLFFT